MSTQRSSPPLDRHDFEKLVYDHVAEHNDLVRLLLAAYQRPLTPDNRRDLLACASTYLMTAHNIFMQVRTLAEREPK